MNRAVSLNLLITLRVNECTSPLGFCFDPRAFLALLFTRLFGRCILLSVFIARRSDGQKRRLNGVFDFKRTPDGSVDKPIMTRFLCQTEFNHNQSAWCWSYQLHTKNPDTANVAQTSEPPLHRSAFLECPQTLLTWAEKLPRNAKYVDFKDAIRNA